VSVDVLDCGMRGRPAEAKPEPRRLATGPLDGAPLLHTALAICTRANPAGPGDSIGGEGSGAGM